MVYLPTFTIKNQLNVCKYTSPMDPRGFDLITYMEVISGNPHCGDQNMELRIDESIEIRSFVHSDGVMIFRGVFAPEKHEFTWRAVPGDIHSG